MNVEITSRHARVGKQVKDHVSDRVNQVLRHVDGITSVHVVLDAEKGRHSAEFIVHGRGLQATVRAESSDVWASVDACAEKLRRQLEHLNGKKREKRRRAEPLSKLDAEMAARALPPPIEEEGPKVIKARAKKAKLLTLDQAKNELDETGAELLIYRDAKTERIFVLHVRRDGDLGLFDTGAE